MKNRKNLDTIISDLVKLNPTIKINVIGLNGKKSPIIKLLPLKIDFKAVYSDENEKIELTYAKAKKSKGEAENEK